MEEQNKTRDEGQDEAVNREHSQSSINENQETVSNEGEETNTQSTETESILLDEVADDKDAEENKFIAALSYFGILVLIPLLLKKESKFAQFHAKQGLVFLIIWVVGWIFFWIPIFGQILALVVLVLNVVALAQALNGKYWEAPVIGDFAKKINL